MNLVTFEKLSAELANGNREWIADYWRKVLSIPDATTDDIFRILAKTADPTESCED